MVPVYVYLSESLICELGRQSSVSANRYLIIQILQCSPNLKSTFPSYNNKQNQVNSFKGHPFLFTVQVNGGLPRLAPLVFSGCLQGYWPQLLSPSGITTPVRDYQEPHPLQGMRSTAGLDWKALDVFWLDLLELWVQPLTVKMSVRLVLLR